MALSSSSGLSFNIYLKKGGHMTPPSKPEWIELAEDDGISRPAKSTKALPLVAVLATALILGVGAVVAQTQEEPPANATEVTNVATDQVASPTTSSEAETPSSPASQTSVEKNAKSEASPSPAAIANPSIAKMPTGGEAGDHEGREGHGVRPPHKEGGEHGSEGDDD